VTSWPQGAPAGYLRGVKMTSKRSMRRTCALVVTAAAVLLPAATASSALAQAGGVAPQLSAPQAAAGWHGQPIRRPLPRREAARGAGPPAGPRLVLGAGYGGADGSDAVRALQRVLHGLGYACGPADGLFGPRTQASVAWFQIKHGLHPTGIADAVTLRVLRQRDRVRAAGPQQGGEPGQRSARAGAPAQRRVPSAPAQRLTSAPTRRATTAGAAGGIGVLPLVLLLAAGAAIASLLSTLAWRRARRGDLTPRARANLAAGARSVGRVVLRAPAAVKPAVVALMSWRHRTRARATDAADAASGGPGEAAAAARPSAIGYASGRDRAELERQAAAIERACSERGWALQSIVREDVSTSANGHVAPALALALDRLATGEASRLVTGRLDHLARSLANLGRLLDWCARHGVDLVAVDVGLDTSTRDGRLAARCLLAAGNGNGAGEPASERIQPQPRHTAAGRGAREGRVGPIATAWHRFAR
jgi:peptidoglycan hydrolase-like protein with peptidoglycan-binding domain